MTASEPTADPSSTSTLLPVTSDIEAARATPCAAVDDPTKPPTTPSRTEAAANSVASWGSWSVGLGLASIVGTGVFVSIGLGAQIAGPAGVIVAIVIACFTATCNALNSAQLAAAYPVSGGTYEYAYRLLHPLAGFLAASAAIGFASYLLTLTRGDLFTAAPDRSAALKSPASYPVLLALSNRANWSILLITLSSLLFFTIGGFLHANPSADLWLSPTYPDRSPVINTLEASALMFVAFTGYGRVATLGDEVRDPQVTIPRAIIATLIVLASCIAPLAVVAMRAFDSIPPAVSGTVLAVGAMAAMAGVLLNLVLGLSRIVFARVNKNGSPMAAVVLMGLLLILTVVVTKGEVKVAWTFSAVTRRFSKAWGMPGRLCLGLAVFVGPMTWAYAGVVIGAGLVVHVVMQKLYAGSAELGASYKTGFLHL
ncbi:amino acid permease-domain-containing protein, partial [Catenaria anguillulae PL171]